MPQIKPYLEFLRRRQFLPLNNSWKSLKSLWSYWGYFNEKMSLLKSNFENCTHSPNSNRGASFGACLWLLTIAVKHWRHCLDDLIHQQAISENTIILFVYPLKFCIRLVFVFSWDHCKSQEKLETMLMQNLGGQTKSIIVFSEVAYEGPVAAKRLVSKISVFISFPFPLLSQIIVSIKLARMNTFQRTIPSTNVHCWDL